MGKQSSAAIEARGSRVSRQLLAIVRAGICASVAFSAAVTAGEFKTARDGITDEVKFEQFATTKAETTSNEGLMVVLQSLFPMGPRSTLKAIVGPLEHQCDGRFIRIRGNDIGWASSVPRESPRPDACMLSIEVAQIAGSKELRIEVPTPGGEPRVVKIDISGLHDGSIRRLCVRGDPKVALEKICSSFSYADLIDSAPTQK